jgi:hypothetical protein
MAEQNGICLLFLISYLLFITMADEGVRQQVKQEGNNT